jgi:hypothetical protein
LLKSKSKDPPSRFEHDGVDTSGEHLVIWVRRASKLLSVQISAGRSWYVNDSGVPGGEDCWLPKENAWREGRRLKAKNVFKMFRCISNGAAVKETV